MQARGNLDGVAAALSSLCLVHCLLLPLALGLSPALGVLGHGPEWLHWALLLMAMPVSVLALRRGRRVHRRALPWMLAAAGFALMAAGALAHEQGIAEQLLTVAGGLLVAGAHLLNWRALQRA